VIAVQALRIGPLMASAAVWLGVVAVTLPAAAPPRRPKPAPSASAPASASATPLEADGAAPPSADSAALAASAAPPASASASAAPATPSASAPASAAAAVPPPPSARPPAPAGSAAPSAAAAPPPARALPVKLHDAVVFSVRAPHGPQTAEQRASAATEALESASESATPDDVRHEVSAGVAVVYAGKAPVIQLYPEDALAAGDSSLDVHAAAVAASIRDAIREEQKRSAIARRVLSFSLVILFGLVAFYLVRKIGDLSGRARDFIADNPDRVPAVRLYSLEVVRPHTLRSGLLLALSLGRWLLQFLIGYLWIVFALSLFASTRAYTERLTGFVFSPVSAMMGRIAASLPVMFVAAIAVIAVAILVRFIGLFFVGIERGQTSVNWLPRDLARPTSVLLQIGVILGALVFAAPVVTGDPEGALSRVGTVALAALALSSTPLLATALVGVSVVYLRRLRPGEFAEIGDHTGRVLDVGLLDIRLEDAQGSEVRVPHLACLLKPVRLLGPTPRVNVEVVAAPAESPPNLRELLLQAVGQVGENATVELIQLDAQGARYRIAVTTAAPDARGQLLLLAHETVTRSRAALGRPPLVPPLPKRSVAP
jgi:small-conductance mechanosensitive channel